MLGEENAYAKIVETGRNCLETGQIDCNITTLCQRARVSHGAFYHYWPNFDSYCNDMYRQAGKHLSNYIFQMFNDPPSEKDITKIFVKESVNWIAWHYMTQTDWGQRNRRRITNFEIKHFGQPSLDILKKIYDIDVNIDTWMTMFHGLLFELSNRRDPRKVLEKFIKLGNTWESS